MGKTGRSIFCFTTIILLGFIDQLSKWYIVERYFKPRVWETPTPSMDFIPWLLTRPQERLEFARTEITSFFNLVMVWNKGVSFGMFASTDGHVPIALIVMALALTSLFVFWMWRAKTLMAALPLAFIISGALSNVWDRARFSAVVDFLDVHIGDLHWPAFNIADSCIVIGVAALAVHTLFFDKSDKKVPTEQQADMA
jgi:signal peptidase II